MKELRQSSKQEYSGASYAARVNWLRGRLIPTAERLVAVCR